ncbi:helix-turn-helix domain-containing protein [Serratia marcescens]|uniref:Helix-turn-helix domain-containing protein n=2 Tax=Serratia TaxID=613 RepID=A0ABD6HNP0_SERMA|nr:MULTISPECIES: helix-turn-helix transcriptional regulator [Serratia]EIT7186288.1 helix-turn-helix domain-containing protein [Serratia marcescens]EJC6392001.1 helix-turn-helix domain-containing protein [Serratia marcescens]MCU7062502.1 helix-turn-helix domain-containing protein [Serratia ureilytica]MDE5260370.1 helix-turn-helix transcriptional regulator [Serratia marcescens]MDQ1809039.1 helix-turn-helix transcriptional regulator [Serratia ureilytica]
MSSDLGEKIRLIREAEGLTRDEFEQLTGVPAGNTKRYETGRIKSIGSDFLTKITLHPRFSKYTLWLMSDLVAPESGQISPALSPDGSNNTSDHQKDQKVG